MSYRPSRHSLFTSLDCLASLHCPNYNFLDIKPDARCCLSNEPTRRGTVRFLGKISSLPGSPNAPWIGVALDEPFGKNDGSVNGERFFQCEKNRGVFVRSEKVDIGDYPELGLEEDDPDMEEI